MQRKSITVIIATKNEEENIAEVIQQARWADEILIVDMHSTDSTVAIAKKLGARVVLHDGGHLHLVGAMKNFAMNQAKSDFVFLLDADQRLTKGFGDEVKKAIQDHAYNCFLARQDNFIFGRIVVSNYGHFIFRKDLMRYEEKSVHANFILKEPLREKKLQGHVIHFGYPSIHSFIEKMNYYTSIDANAMVQQGFGGFTNAKVGKVTVQKMLFKSIKEFFHQYLKQGWWKSGSHGFVLSMYMAIYLFVEQSKVWSKQYYQAHKNRIDEYFKKYGKKRYEV